mgnify:CR=1 FL=1
MTQQVAHSWLHARTQIQLVVLIVIDHFEQPHHIWMMQLLHDGNLTLRVLPLVGLRVAIASQATASLQERLGHDFHRLLRGQQTRAYLSPHCWWRPRRRLNETYVELIIMNILHQLDLAIHAAAEHTEHTVLVHQLKSAVVFTRLQENDRNSIQSRAQVATYNTIRYEYYRA